MCIPPLSANIPEQHQRFTEGEESPSRAYWDRYGKELSMSVEYKSEDELVENTKIFCKAHKILSHFFLSVIEKYININANFK